MTLYYVCVYHRDAFHRGPYERGQLLNLTVSYWWHFPDGYTDQQIAHWLCQQLNGDTDPLRTNAAGEFGFLAGCVYKLMGNRPLQTGDVIELVNGDDSHFLAREDTGWRTIDEPSHATGEELSSEKVDRYLDLCRLPVGGPANGELTEAADDALPQAHKAGVLAALRFMTACARDAGIPHAEHWQLHYANRGINPWRIIDRAARRGPGGNHHVVLTFTCARADLIAVEMHCYAKAWRGLTELHQIGTSGDLIAPSRLWAVSRTWSPAAIAE